MISNNLLEITAQLCNSLLLALNPEHPLKITMFIIQGRRKMMKKKMRRKRKKKTRQTGTAAEGTIIVRITIINTPTVGPTE